MRLNLHRNRGPIPHHDIFPEDVAIDTGLHVIPSSIFGGTSWRKWARDWTETAGHHTLAATQIT